MSSQELAKDSGEDTPIHGEQRRAGGEAPADSEQAGEEALSGEPEAWEPWETQLVIWSLVAGAAGLVVLGWLVDRFILS